MVDPPPIDFAAFDRYVRGSAPAAEAAAVREWLVDPVNALIAQHWMRCFWDTLAEESADRAQPLETTPDWQRLRTVVRDRLLADTPGQEEMQPGTVLPTTARPLLRPARLRRWSAVALGLTLLGGAWLGFRQLTPTPTEPDAVQYATTYGHTRTVRLPDGSQVALNANSTLRYTNPTANGPREAWLDGEGYFEVQHQADDRRFVVHTANGPDVEVLGTRFNVYRRHGRAEVVLISGKVRVSFPDHQHADVLMQPGEQVAVSDAQPAMVVHAPIEQAETAAAWKDGRLVLNEMPIGELATRLHDTYGIDIEVRGDELKNRKISGTLIVSDLDVLVVALRESFKLNVTKEHGRIIVSDN